MSREFVVGGLFGPIDLSQTGARQVTLSGVDDDENVAVVVNRRTFGQRVGSRQRGFLDLSTATGEGIAWKAS